MSITTVSSREFNQDVGKAKRATSKGPVFITDRGHAAHVLLTISEYEKIAGTRVSIVELLAMPKISAEISAEISEIDFEPPRLDKDLYRPADLGSVTE